MEASKKINMSSDVGAFEEADDDTLREINLLREKIIYSEDELMKLNKQENIEEKEENEEKDEEKNKQEEEDEAKKKELEEKQKQEEEERIKKEE